MILGGYSWFRAERWHFPEPGCRCAQVHTHMKTATLPAPRREIVLISCGEAAKLLRLTTKTIRAWIADGRLAAKKTFPGRGGKLLLDRDQVLRAVGFAE